MLPLLLLIACGGEKEDGENKDKDAESSQEVKKAPTKDDLISLNNQLVAKQNKLFDDYDQFFVVVETGNVEAMKRQLAAWEKDTDEVIELIHETEDYEETEEFKNALIKIANFQHEFVLNEAAEITKFFENVNDYTEDEYNSELERLITAIEDFEDEFLIYNDDFVVEQKKFAKEHNITLS